MNSSVHVYIYVYEYIGVCEFMNARHVHVHIVYICVIACVHKYMYLLPSSKVSGGYSRVL